MRFLALVAVILLVAFVLAVKPGLFAILVIVLVFLALAAATSSRWR